jgi:hypothetical protein
MKSINKYIALLSAVLVLASGCRDILEEEPRSTLTPDLFETAQGLEGGLTAAYAYLRYYYGTEGGHNLTVYGTDEFTNGNQTTDPPLNTYRALTPANGEVTTPWNRAYPAINTLNGVIELAPQVADLTEEQRQNIIGEAKYLRAQWYFILAETFGGVTLDLGSGPLAFNRTPSTNFERASLAETYEAIVQDLEDAVDLLPMAPRDPGRAWKATAYHLLAKAYLSRGWSDAAQGSDFQNALNAAQQLIPDATSPSGNFGTRLLEDFEEVFREGNEYNEEVLLTANRLGDLVYNEVRMFTSNDADLQQNRSNFFFRMFYTEFPGMERDVENGRPWIRYRPTDWLMTEAFNNKTEDSRWDKSFQTVWIANDPDPESYPVWTAADAAAGYADESEVGEPKFFVGDTAVWFVPDHINLTPDEIAAKGFTIRRIPEEVSKGHFPSLKKFDATARPIEGTEDDPNIASYRPYIIHRLAETYLIAAEAALMTGNTGLAADYINTVRRRAAWPGQENEMLITAGDVDIDFILDERTRELAGEQKRWFDLKRTKTLQRRAERHNPDVVSVQEHHYLRPIPQSQIDLTDNAYPQNPGYNQ